MTLRANVKRFEMTTPHKRPLRGPDPVGAKRVKTLLRLRQRDGNWQDAPMQYAALERMGYVRHTNDCDGDLAQITNAGLALLDRQLRSDTK